MYLGPDVYTDKYRVKMAQGLEADRPLDKLEPLREVPACAHGAVGDHDAYLVCVSVTPGKTPNQEKKSIA